MGDSRPGADLPAWWRHLCLSSLIFGLILAGVGVVGTPGEGVLPVSIAGVVLACVFRPERIGVPPVPWLLILALCLVLLGAGVGAQRVAGIDGGAYRAAIGERVDLAGYVVAPLRRGPDGVRVRLATRAGAVMAVVPEPVDRIPLGSEVRVVGTVVEPPFWQAEYLTRLGIARVVEAEHLVRTGASRDGLLGLSDRVRNRAEDALASGTRPAEAALLAGFVLGQDDDIDPQTTSDFKRASLAHLLAVSGQNVMLLILLATPILAPLGVSLRARLAVLLVVIGAYVLVTGAGPSIQRAGVMGAAAIVAGLAGRPASRWYALLLAAVVTLTLNPYAIADVGWQLSFAAVVGIALWTSDLSVLFRGGERGRGGSSPGGALADGAAMTLAAVLATAPLMAHHFGTASLVSVPANLLALPAVAPVMWLGMLVGALGQVSTLLPPVAWVVQPLSALGGVCAAYIAGVGAWTARPEWAQIGVGLDSPVSLLLAYLLLPVAMSCTIAATKRRRGTGLRWLEGLARRARLLVVLACMAAAIAVGSIGGLGAGKMDPPAPDQLRITFLDVGQGDAILLQPGEAPPVVVDAGPPGTDLAPRLRRLGVEEVGIFIASHADTDHIGGLPALAAAMPTRRLGYGLADPGLTAGLRNRITSLPLLRGDGFRVGEMRMEVLWPPPEMVEPGSGAIGSPMAAAEPNRASVVLLVRWHGFRMLLTGDAEAGTTPLTPGRLDLLKVAHHGSEDGGLASLLRASAPQAAVISVGDDNRYGHPHPTVSTALTAAGVRILRTDRDGDVTVSVDRDGWLVEG